MSYDNVNYGESFYNTKELRYFAEMYLRYLPKEVNTLVSMGSSGNSIASAMLILSDRPLSHIQVRKSKEDAHMSEYAGWFQKNAVCAIVDDFISCGNTVQTLINFLESKKQDNISLNCILVNHGKIDADVPILQVEHLFKISLEIERVRQIPSSIKTPDVVVIGDSIEF